MEIADSSPDGATLPNEYLLSAERFNECRHAYIEVFWQRYSDGEFQRSEDSIETASLEVIPHSSLYIGAIRSEEDDGRVGSIRVRKLAEDNDYINFMGFDPTERCWAFRGQEKFQDQFLDMAMGVGENQHMEIVMKAPCDIHIPKCGLEPLLDYDEFAACVEIIEMVVWIKDDVDGQDDIVTMIGVPQDGEQICTSLGGSRNGFESGPAVQTLDGESPSSHESETANQGIPVEASDSTYDGEVSGELSESTYRNTGSSVDQGASDEYIPPKTSSSENEDSSNVGKSEGASIDNKQPDNTPTTTDLETDGQTRLQEQTSRDAELAASLASLETGRYALRSRRGAAAENGESARALRRSRRQANR